MALRNDVLLSLIAMTLGVWLTACSSDSGSSDTDTAGTEESSGATDSGDSSDSTGTDAAVASYSYLILDSGQYECYDDDGESIDCPAEGEDFYGQDAQYQGHEIDLTDNGDGTVLDNVTGLTWQQSPENQGRSWYEAEAYCQSLDLSGYTWRLPSTKELFSISDFSEGWPYIDTEYFDLAIDGEVSKDEQYWSDQYAGVTVEGQDDAAFGVNHATGHIKAYAASVSGQFGNYTRCVSGESYGTNSFQDNGDGTVTDWATGLMWSQDDDGAGMQWVDALAYAENAELAGYNDWRLPSIKELQSIVDYSQSPTATDEANLGPAIDTDYFNITELPQGTTNTETDYGYFWSSTSAYFSLASPGYYYGWYVAFGTAVNDDGDDFHGAGAMRFDTKAEGGPAAEEAERYYNYVRLVRDL